MLSSTSLAALTAAAFSALGAISGGAIAAKAVTVFASVNIVDKFSKNHLYGFLCGKDNPNHSKGGSNKE